MICKIPSPRNTSGIQLLAPHWMDKCEEGLWDSALVSEIYRQKKTVGETLRPDVPLNEPKEEKSHTTEMVRRPVCGSRKWQEENWESILETLNETLLLYLLK